MVKFSNKITLAFALLLLVKCTPPSSKGSSVQEKSNQHNEWVKDKCGCKHLRNKELADSLLISNKLMGEDKEAFLNVFHSPDSIAKSGDADIFIYYFDSICENDKPAPGSDKCYANFYFKDNKLATTDYLCE